MPKRLNRSKGLTNPNILRRKRKAERNMEQSFDGSESSLAQEGVPLRSSFSHSHGVEVLLNAHPLMRPATFPDFPWAPADEVWKSLINKDIIYCHNSNIFSRHPQLQPRMRAILLDWLIEVCEVYKLHRQTLYLAQDCIDRYLAKKENVPKHQLQLIGITSLFISAKIEEIYPPKLPEFAYVTDGACTEQEILHKELVILMTLDWNFTPVTVNSWLNVFLQVAMFNESQSENFEVQNFSSDAFSQLCELLDLCILDVSCLQFPYSILSATAIAHLVSKDLALKVSGFKFADIAECFHWMQPFVSAINEHEKLEQKYFQNIPKCDMHNIQTHNVGLKLLEHVHRKQAELAKGSPSSEAVSMILTPPQTVKKLCLKRVSV